MTRSRETRKCDATDNTEDRFVSIRSVGNRGSVHVKKSTDTERHLTDKGSAVG